MATVCPAILAKTSEDFDRQMTINAKFASRIQIDLTDGEFAESKTVGLDDVWWPNNITADIHLMYQNPFDYLEKLLHLKPSMVIIHVEAMIHHMHFSAELHKEGISTGLAILPETPVTDIEQIINSFDHLLIFSGNLGYYGGTTDLGLLGKVSEAKGHHPNLEIGWDGGINYENARTLTDGGVDVLAVGGFIQKAENPSEAYKLLLETLA